MAHDLELNRTGDASLAYSTNYGTPWHQLGTPLNGLQTPSQILTAANADWQVLQQPATMTHPDTGQVIPVKGRKINYRRRPTVIDADGVDGGDIQPLGIVGDNYRIIQNREALTLAYNLADLDPDSAHMDVAGVLNDATFFAYIRLPDTVIDPQGIADRIATGLGVVTGHDGRTALHIVESKVRTVCRNTVNAALGSAAKISVRHTGNDPLGADEARRILNLHHHATDAFAATVTELLAKPATFDDVRRIADPVFDYKPTQASDRQAAAHAERIDQLERLWNADTNAGGFGSTAWTAFNTVAEFLDHCGRGDATEQATRTLTSPTVKARKEHTLALLNT